MKTKEDVQKVLNYFQSLSEIPIKIDESKIENHLKKIDKTSTLSIKLLSILGGFLASLAFLGFLLITDSFDSEIVLIISGIFCLLGSYLLFYKNLSLMFDTLGISLYSIGYLLLGIAFVKMKIDTNIVCILFIAISFIFLLKTKGFSIPFLSLLIIHTSSLVLIFQSDNHTVFPIYASFLVV